MLVSHAIPRFYLGTDHSFISLTATLGILLIYWIFGHASYSSKETMENTNQKVKYEAVTGYFLQDDPKTDPNTFEYVCHFPFTYNRAFGPNNFQDKT